MKRKKTVALTAVALTLTMTACGSSTAITESVSTEESASPTITESVLAEESASSTITESALTAESKPASIRLMQIRRFMHYWISRILRNLRMRRKV